VIAFGAQSVGAPDDPGLARWLHPIEREAAARLSIAKRRAEYLAGRVAAKRALAALVGGEPGALAIVPSEGARAGAPIVRGAGGQRLPIALSISHAAGAAIACASDEPGEAGIDLEAVERRHPAFVEESFTDGELRAFAAALGLAGDDPRAVTAAWCAKEALLKRAGCGLRAPLHDHAVLALDWGAPAPRTAGGPIASIAPWPLRWARAATTAGACRLGLALDGSRALAVALDATAP